MLRRIRYIIIAIMLCSALNSAAQVAMPDDVCIGTTRIYKVNDSSIPSTYTWKIDDVVQSSTTNQLTVTWDKVGTYLVTVQEHTSDGCDGEIQSGYVYVHPI